MWMCPVICLNSKSFKIFLLAVLPWIPPSPILSSRPVLNVSSDKSSECFMPRNPDVGHRQNKSGSLNIKLFLTFNKSWSVELFWADLHWIGSLEPWAHKWTPPPPEIETSKGGKMPTMSYLNNLCKTSKYFNRSSLPLYGQNFEWQRSRVLISGQFTTAYEGWQGGTKKGQM